MNTGLGREDPSLEVERPPLGIGLERSRRLAGSSTDHSACEVHFHEGESVRRFPLIC